VVVLERALGRVAQGQLVVRLLEELGRPPRVADIVPDRSHQQGQPLDVAEQGVELAVEQEAGHRLQGVYCVQEVVERVGPLVALYHHCVQEVVEGHDPDAEVADRPRYVENRPAQSQNLLHPTKIKQFVLPLDHLANFLLGNNEI
jgi:hypothetical protein